MKFWLLKQILKSIIRHGNYVEYKNLFKLIIKTHENEFSEENFHTMEVAIQEILAAAMNDRFEELRKG
jgi:hypothetical protein